MAAPQRSHSAAARPQGTAGAATAGGNSDQCPPLSPAQEQLRRLRLPSPFERHEIAADDGPLIGHVPDRNSLDSAASFAFGASHQPITLADRIPSLAEWAGGAHLGIPTTLSAERLASLAAERAPSLTPWIAAGAASGDVHAAMDAAAAAAMAESSRAVPVSLGHATSAALPVAPIRPLHMSRPSSLEAISEQQPPSPTPELLSRRSPKHPLNAPSVPLGPFRLGPALRPHSAAAASPTFATAAFPSLQFEGEPCSADADPGLQAEQHPDAEDGHQGSAPAHEEPSLRAQLFAAVGVAMDALWFGRSRQDGRSEQQQSPPQEPLQEQQQDE